MGLGNPNLFMVLVANKVDLETKRQVDSEVSTSQLLFTFLQYFDTLESKKIKSLKIKILRGEEEEEEEKGVGRLFTGILVKV